MIRRIITIDEEKCNGCGLCARACHEGAIGILEGKAKLLREDYCDGLGDCLPACPLDAISFEEREAPAYDEAAVLAAKKAKEEAPSPARPGTQVPVSRLRNFPIQIRLLPPNAAFFDGADLLIAADCTAYSYGSFHQDFMQDKVTMIGCPQPHPLRHRHPDDRALLRRTALRREDRHQKQREGHPSEHRHHHLRREDRRLKEDACVAFFP